MKIQFVCLLLVLLSATVHSQDAIVLQRYRKFITQHINGQMRIGDCDKEIGRRGIATDSNECKETNTFIRASTDLVKGICLQAGRPYGQMRISLQPFNVIVCKLKNQVRPPRCEYRGQDRTRDIVIRCEQGFPVHFDEDVVPAGV